MAFNPEDEFRKTEISITDQLVQANRTIEQQEAELTRLREMDEALRAYRIAIDKALSMIQFDGKAYRLLTQVCSDVDAALLTPTEEVTPMSDEEAEAYEAKVMAQIKAEGHTRVPEVR